MKAALSRLGGAVWAWGFRVAAAYFVGMGAALLLADAPEVPSWVSSGRWDILAAESLDLSPFLAAWYLWTTAARLRDWLRGGELFTRREASVCAMVSTLFFPVIASNHVPVDVAVHMLHWVLAAWAAALGAVCVVDWRVGGKRGFFASPVRVATLAFAVGACLLQAWVNR
jgi:hypothetical protein